MNGADPDPLDSLRQRLSSGEPLAGFEKVVEHIGQLRNLANQMLDVPADLREVIKLAASKTTAPSPVQPTSPRHPLQGSIGKYPEHAALWTAADAGVDPHGLRFAHLVILAAAYWKPDMSGDENYSSTRREAGLACRQAAKDEPLARLILEAGSTCSSVKDLGKAFEGAAAKLSDDPESARRLSALARLLRYAIGEDTPHARGPQVRERRIEGDEEDLEGEPPAGASLLQTGGERKLERDLVRLGAAPAGEGCAPSHAIVGCQDLGLEYHRDLRAKYGVAQHRARAITSAAQHLPMASDRLQLHDLTVLLDWFSKGDPDSSSPYRDAALTAFLTGLPSDGLPRVRVAQSPPALNADPDVVVLDLSTLSWWLPKLVLKDAFTPDEEERELYWPTDDRLALPISRSFPGVPRLVARAVKIHNGLLFREPANSLREGIRRELNVLNQRFGSRLSLRRISDFLSRFTADRADDRTLDSLLSAAPEPSGADARLYYYAPRTSSLTARYTESLKWVDKLHRGGAPPAIDQNVIANQLASRRIGSRGVAQPDVLKTNIKNIAADLAPVGRGRKTVRALIYFHNRLTAYTARMAYWATGVRAVGDPIEFELIDLRSGYIGISDKDQDSFQDSRIVWLPPLVRRQLRAYEVHREHMLAILSREGFNLPKTWLFFIDGVSCIAVTPSGLAVFQPDWRFRANAQRHFLCTELRERGVPGSAVDAWLGHGAYGQEAYGQYSCLSPAEVRDCIGPTLENLINEQGWAVINGLGPARDTTGKTSVTRRSSPRSNSS